MSATRKQVPTAVETTVATPQPVNAPLQAALLIGEPKLHDARSGCRQGACTEVSVELHEAAYLLVFRTQHGSVAPLQCRTKLVKKTPGEQRYRVHLGTEPQQRVGLYVIASRERQALAALSRQIQSAPGACGNPASRDAGPWLQTTLAEVGRQRHQLHWRAVHLTNTASGPSIL